MFQEFYQVQMWIAFAAAAIAFVLGLAKRKPNLVSIGSLALIELGLVAQLVLSIVLVVSGERAQKDTFEFFAYLVVALMVPAAAIFWALIERNRWSTYVLSVGAFASGVMLARMAQLWFGA